MDCIERQLCHKGLKFSFAALCMVSKYSGCNGVGMHGGASGGRWKEPRVVSSTPGALPLHKRLSEKGIVKYYHPPHPRKNLPLVYAKGYILFSCEASLCIDCLLSSRLYQ